MKIPKLILGRPKIVVDIKCPKCKSLDIAGFSNVECRCNNCKTAFTTEAGVNIYYSIAKKLIQLISHNNEVWVIGERDDSETFRSEDLLKPRSKHEDDIYHSLLAIKNNFQQQRCYDVSEITNEMDTDYRANCSDCGYCSNCVICAKCNKSYVPKKTRSGEKRYTCPECKSKNYKPSAIKFKADGGKRSCPNCSSENVNRTKVPAGKKPCPKCNSENITSPRKLPIYRLIIKRQRRFLLDE